MVYTTMLQRIGDEAPAASSHAVLTVSALTTSFHAAPTASFHAALTASSHAALSMLAGKVPCQCPVAGPQQRLPAPTGKLPQPLVLENHSRS